MKMKRRGSVAALVAECLDAYSGEWHTPRQIQAFVESIRPATLEAVRKALSRMVAAGEVERRDFEVEDPGFGYSEYRVPYRWEIAS